MMPPAGQPIVTAAGMRAVENAAIVAGATVESLMQRAGQEIAHAVRRLAGANPILILCGPGNNGGDGYVAARLLGEAGLDVRVAALTAPKTAAAKAARAGWSGPVEPLSEATSAPVLIDALFGIGVSRPLDPADAGNLRGLVQAAQLSIAIDVPSGVTTDDGRVLNDLPAVDLTLALGALKPCHLLQPAARYCGALCILDIGIDISSDVHALSRPSLPKPGPDSHKYSRGMVAVVGGAMPGAAHLASIAALRAGAGYVLLLADTQGGPDALVHKPFSASAIADKRIGALLVGPGLGRDGDAEDRLDVALATDHALVIDGDALHLLKGARLVQLAERNTAVILTPHAGEFEALFPREGVSGRNVPRTILERAGHAQPDTGPDWVPAFAGTQGGIEQRFYSKIERTRAAARQANAIVVHKGPDTVIAAPDGRVRVAGNASNWLSTAGTGDVLAGAIAAALATGIDPLEAAAAGVWLHADAARRLGPAFIADDLAHALTAARAAQ